MKQDFTFHVAITSVPTNLTFEFFNASLAFILLEKDAINPGIAMSTKPNHCKEINTRNSANREK